MWRRRGGAAAAVLLTTFAMAWTVPAAPAAAAACGGGSVTVTRVSAPILYLDLSASPQVNSAYEAFSVTNDSGSAYDDLWVEDGSFAGPRIHLASNESARAHLGSLAAGATAPVFFYLTADAATTSPESHTISVYTSRPDLAPGPLCTSSVSLSATEDIAAAANKVTSVVPGPTPPQLGGAVTITVTGDTGTIGSEALFATTPASYASWPADSYAMTGSSIVLSGGNTGTFTNNLYLTGLASPTTHYVATFTFTAVGTTSTPTTVSPMSHISSGTQTKHTSIDADYKALAPIQPPSNQITLALAATPATLPVTGGTATWTVTVSNAGTTAVTLDDFVVTLPTGVSYDAGSATWDGSAIADPSSSGATLTFVDQFSVPAGGSRELELTSAVPDTVGTYTTTAVGHVASTQVDTTANTSDDSPASASTTVPPPPPTVTSVIPASGPTTGGTTVIIEGTNFTGATAVEFGGTAAPSFTVGDDTHIVATTPAGSGTVHVTVTTPGGTSATSADDLFSYVAPPNSPPEFTADAANTSQSVTLGAGLTALQATDPDDDPLTFSLGSGTLPAGITLNSDGTFTGTTSSAGDTTADITVDDGRGGTDSTTLQVHVAAAPTITITGGATATTNDPTPTISGSTDAPSGATVTVTVGGQTLTTTVEPDGSWSVTAAELADGTYTVTASVADGLGNTATANQELTVDAVAATTTTTASTTTTTASTTTAASTSAVVLPFTGLNVMVLSTLVVGLLLVGATLLRGGRCRDRR